MQLLKPDEIAERLQCSRNKAASLMRSMPHINISNGNERQMLRVTDEDFQLWLRGRKLPAMLSPRELKEQKKRRKTAQAGIPYRRAT